MMIHLLLMIIAMIPAASADITTSRELYSDGGSVSEEVSLHNAQFTNEISISESSAYSTGSIEPAESAGGESSAKVNMRADGVGASFFAEGQNLRATKTTFAGYDGPLAMGTYSLEDGRIEAQGYSGFASSEENAHFNDCYYAGLIFASPTYLAENGHGYGSSQGVEAGDVEHTATLSGLGKSSTVQTKIEFDKDEGFKPLTFNWLSQMGASKGSYYSGHAVYLAEGDSFVDAKLYGTSTELEPKNEALKLYPLNLENADPDDPFFKDTWFDDPDFNKLMDIIKRAGVSQEIYMSYSVD